MNLLPAYHDSGPPHAPALVLLHGFMGSKEDWTPLLPSLTRRWRCVTVDLPGHGDTRTGDPGCFTMPGAAAMLDHLLDHLESNRVALLGYSMGGRLALFYALARPGRLSHLVLVSASPGLADAKERAARRERDHHLARRLRHEGLPAVLADWYDQSVFRSLRNRPNLREELVARKRRNDPEKLAMVLEGMGTGTQPPLWDRLSELTTPTLVVAGEQDDKFAGIARRMVPLCPQAELCIIAGSGHLPHREQPDRFCRAVLGFLEAT